MHGEGRSRLETANKHTVFGLRVFKFNITHVIFKKTVFTIYMYRDACRKSTGNPSLPPSHLIQLLTEIVVF